MFAVRLLSPRGVAPALDGPERKPAAVAPPKTGVESHAAAAVVVAIAPAVSLVSFVTVSIVVDVVVVPRVVRETAAFPRRGEPPSVGRDAAPFFFRARRRAPAAPPPAARAARTRAPPAGAFDEPALSLRRAASIRALFISLARASAAFRRLSASRASRVWRNGLGSAIMPSARSASRVEPFADADGTADVTDPETASIFPRVSRIVSSTADFGCGR